MSFGNLWMNNNYSNYNNSTSGSWLVDGDFSNVLKSGTGFNNVNINIFGNRFCEPSVGSSLGFLAGGLSSMLIGGLLGGLFSGGNRHGQQIQQNPQNLGLGLDYFTSSFAAINAQSLPTVSSVTPAVTTTGTSSVTGSSGAQNTTNNNSNVNSKGTANIPGNIPIDGDITALTNAKPTDKLPQSFTIKDKITDKNGGQDEFTFHFKSADNSGNATYTVDIAKDIKNNNKDFTINSEKKTYEFTIKAGALTKGSDGKYKIDMNAIANQAAIMKKTQS